MEIGFRGVKGGSVDFGQLVDPNVNCCPKVNCSKFGHFVVFVCTWMACEEVNENVNEDDILMDLYEYCITIDWWPWQHHMNGCNDHESRSWKHHMNGCND